MRVKEQITQLHRHWTSLPSICVFQTSFGLFWMCMIAQTMIVQSRWSCGPSMFIFNCFFKIQLRSPQILLGQQFTKKQWSDCASTTSRELTAQNFCNHVGVKRPDGKWRKRACNWDAWKLWQRALSRSNVCFRFVTVQANVLVQTNSARRNCTVERILLWQWMYLWNFLIAMSAVCPALLN